MLNSHPISSHLYLLLPSHLIPSLPAPPPIPSHPTFISYIPSHLIPPSSHHPPIPSHTPFLSSSHPISFHLYLLIPSHFGPPWILNLCRPFVPLDVLSHWTFYPMGYCVYHRKSCLTGRFGLLIVF